MKKLLSLLSTITIAGNGMVGIIGNASVSAPSKETKIDIVIIDGVEYKKEKINLNYYGTNNVLSINVIHNDNVIINYFDKHYFIKSNEINAVEINNNILKDKLGNEYFTENGKLFIKDNSNIKTEIKNINDGINNYILDNKNNLYIYTLNSKLYFLESGKFTVNEIISLRKNNNFSINKIFIDKSNNLFVATTQGLFKTEDMGKNFKQINNQDIRLIIIGSTSLLVKSFNRDWFMIKNDVAKQIKNFNSNGDTSIQIWDKYVVIDNNDIFQIDPNDYENTDINVSKISGIGISDNIYPFMIDVNNEYIFIPTNKGLYYLKQGETTVTKINELNNKISSIDLQKEKIYINSDKKLYYLNYNDLKLNSINTSYAMDITKFDSKGNIFYSIDKDVFKLTPIEKPIPHPIPPASNNKLSKIAIASIAIGSVVGVAFVVLGSCYLYKYMNKKKKQNKTTETK